MIIDNSIYLEKTTLSHIKAYAEAVALVDRIVKDQPWNDDAREAAANLRIASELSVWITPYLLST